MVQDTKASTRSRARQNRTWQGTRHAKREHGHKNEATEKVEQVDRRAEPDKGMAGWDRTG